MALYLTFGTVLARILSPDALLRAAALDECVAVGLDATPRPRPEPEIMARRMYHQAMCERNRAAAITQRDQIVDLEVEVLVTLAESHAVVRKSKTIRPLIA